MVHGVLLEMERLLRTRFLLKQQLISKSDHIGRTSCNVVVEARIVFGSIVDHVVSVDGVRRPMMNFDILEEYSRLIGFGENWMSCSKWSKGTEILRVLDRVGGSCGKRPQGQCFLVEIEMMSSVQNQQRRRINLLDGGPAALPRFLKEVLKKKRQADGGILHNG